MGKITVVKRDDVAPIRAADRMDAEQLARFGDGEARSLRRGLLPAGGEDLQLFEISLEAGADVQPHAHTASEIIYVTSGEIRLGAQVCGAGTAIYVEANTLYGFRAGAAGVTFLNFRPTPKVGYLTKDDILARRRSAGD